MIMIKQNNSIRSHALGISVKKVPSFSYVIAAVPNTWWISLFSSLAALNERATSYPKNCVGAPSLELFKVMLDGALSNLV